MILNGLIERIYSRQHPPVMGGKKSKSLGGIIGCKDKTSWHSIGFSDGISGNIGCYLWFVAFGLFPCPYNGMEVRQSGF